MNVNLHHEKLVVSILLEPGLDENDYESKYVPLMEKYLDFDLFTVHVIGSSAGSRALIKKFNNVHVIPFHPTKTSGLGLYLGYVLYLVYAFLKVFRISSKTDTFIIVSLCGHSYSGFVVALVAKVLRRKSLVRISEPTRQIVYVRYVLGPLISRLVSIAEHLTFELCDVVITNRDMRWYSSKIVAKQRLLSQGADLLLFNPRVAPAFHSLAFPKLITVARLDKQKNIEGVIEAVGLLEEKYPEILYYIVGSGSDEVELRDKVTKLALDEHIYFYGYVSPETVPRLLRSCDVFVLPSFIEGLPSAVLEAMACGLPAIVGSTRYSWKEWFIDGENSLIVKSGPQSIAEAVDQLISNEELRNKLIVNGLKHVREYHDSSKTKTQFIAIVQQLLKNP